MKKILIRGFAGVGKTYLGQKYKNIVDLESSDYKWIYNEEVKELDREKRKSITNKKLNKEFPNNYIEAILDSFKKYDIVLIAPDEDIAKALDDRGIDYIICFPKEECKSEYINRYKKRGNEFDFIDIREKNFEKRVKELNNSNHDKIILNKGEYLEDYLLKHNLLHN